VSFSGKSSLLRAMVEVSKLISPELLVEIEVTAIVGEV
jgi:enamine deaminase RidA (YjgF/YER057c/UK114 family)